MSLLRFIAPLLLPAVAAATPQEVPELTGRVVDGADVISAEVESEVTATLAAFEARTSHQVAVLTLPTLDGGAIEEFSIRVAREWGLGSAQENNGVLFLIVPGDRKTRLEVGTGLEGVLTDLQSAKILRGIVRGHLQADDHDTGVRAGVEAIITVLDGGELDVDYPSSSSDENLTPLGVSCIVIFLLLALGLLNFAALMTGGGLQFAFFLLFGNPLALGAGFLMGIPLGFWATYFVGYLLLAGFFAFMPGGRRLHKRLSKKFDSGSSSSSSSSYSWSSSSSSSGSSSGFSGGGGDFAGGGASDDY